MKILANCKQTSELNSELNIFCFNQKCFEWWGPVRCNHQTQTLQAVVKCKKDSVRLQINTEHRNRKQGIVHHMQELVSGPRSLPTP